MLWCIEPFGLALQQSLAWVSPPPPLQASKCFKHTCINRSYLQGELKRPLVKTCHANKVKQAVSFPVAFPCNSFSLRLLEHAGRGLRNTAVPSRAAGPVAVGQAVVSDFTDEAQQETSSFQHWGLASSVPGRQAEEEALCCWYNTGSGILSSRSPIDVYLITLILLFSSPRPLLAFPGSWFYQCCFKIWVTKDKLSVSKPWFAQCNFPVHFLCSSNIVAVIF